jgi:hypothetical protein
MLRDRLLATTVRFMMPPEGLGATAAVRPAGEAQQAQP